MKPIRATFIGVQQLHDGTKVMLYNILEPIGDGSVHPELSTVTLNTLERYGLKPIEGEKNLLSTSHV